jgi:hypothetical protein
MIHIATVHWRTDRWVDIQLRYLERYVPGEFRTYAFLNGMPADHSEKFFYSSNERVKDHATKLNLLGDVIGFAAADDSDPLIFIDGDAFPIAPLDGLLEDLGSQAPLIAVRRAELGDPQPHPCFCVTTVGFWRQIGGDWHPGHEWKNAAGKKVSDVGGNLLGLLDDGGITWRPLERSNTKDIHPLYFGVYGDVVYHHGGGFRMARGGRLLNQERGLPKANATSRARALDALPRNRATKALRQRYHPGKQIVRELREETATLSREVFAQIEGNEGFWQQFTR